MASSNSNAFDFAKKVDPKIVAQALGDESTSIVAMTLNSLEPQQRAATLKALPPTKYVEIIKQMTRQETVASDVIKAVAEQLRHKCSTISKQTHTDGLKTAANILRHMAGREVLDALKEKDPLLFDTLGQEIISINEICQMHPRHLQILFNAVPDAVLTSAFYDLSKAQKLVILAAVSQRRAQDLKEGQTANDPAESEKAQNQIVAIAKELQKSGKVIIDPSSGVV